jgi:hypothetical protein
MRNDGETNGAADTTRLSVAVRNCFALAPSVTAAYVENNWYIQQRVNNKMCDLFCWNAVEMYELYSLKMTI